MPGVWSGWSSRAAVTTPPLAALISAPYPVQLSGSVRSPVKIRPPASICIQSAANRSAPWGFPSSPTIALTWLVGPGGAFDASQPGPSSGGESTGSFCCVMGTRAAG